MVNTPAASGHSCFPASFSPGLHIPTKSPDVNGGVPASPALQRCASGFPGDSAGSQGTASATTERAVQHGSFWCCPGLGNAQERANHSLEGQQAAGLVGGGAP